MVVHPVYQVQVCVEALSGIKRRAYSSHGLMKTSDHQHSEDA